jgi:mannosyltransferase
MVLGLTALGALLRFSTLDRQSFWLDELVTGSLLRLDFRSMLDAIPDSERTPYLYYVLAWGWTHVFGDGEIGVRSLSALAGALTVPVAYGAGASLVSRRAGVLAAALVAVNPFLVWYSQEARAYALVSLLSALSLLFFGRALAKRPHALAWWAVASTLAIATHYFAAFAVAPQAIWLMARAGPRRRVVAVACLVPALALIGHAPLAAAQAGDGRGIGASGLATRLAGVLKNAVVGYSFPLELAGTLCAGALVAAGLALGLRAAGSARRGIVVAWSVAAVTVAVPAVLALVGPDYVIARNTIVAVVPAAVGLAGGYATSRFGLAAAAGLCLLSLAIVVAVAADTRYGRTDWRGAAEALARPGPERAVVVSPSMSPALWSPYVNDLREPTGPLTTREIVVLGLATEGAFGAGTVEAPAAKPSTPPRGFRVVEARWRPTLALVRYAAPRPTRVTLRDLDRLRLAGSSGRVLIQSAR